VHTDIGIGGESDIDDPRGCHRDRGDEHANGGHSSEADHDTVHNPSIVAKREDTTV
jgi:hypothetical protein